MAVNQGGGKVATGPQAAASLIEQNLIAMEETDRQKLRLERLNRRLAEIDAERRRIENEAEALGVSLTKYSAGSFWRRAVLTVVSILVAVSLLSAGIFHEAQSSVNTIDSPRVSALDALERARVELAEQAPASETAQAQTFRKARPRPFRARAASQRQWGPLLVMSEPQAAKRYYGFDPVVKAQQKDLLTLGFDVGEADGFKGPNTRRAIAEFRALYMPESGSDLRDKDLAVVMAAYANLARTDAARFGIDHGIVAAIRLSSIRTGVDFSYLMKLAATESNFEPESESATSSATGMYQFTHDTWLDTLKQHGPKYGLVGDYAANIDYVRTRSGYRRPVVRDETVYQHLLDLRKNPRVAAMMAAETVRDYEQTLVHTLEREPTETDLYLTHFLGLDDAITFLQSLKQSPGTHAVKLFPEAARSNHDVFHPSTCDPYTVDDVYTLFEERLSRRGYGQSNTREMAYRAEKPEAARSSAALSEPALPYDWEQGRAL